MRGTLCVVHWLGSKQVPASNASIIAHADVWKWGLLQCSGHQDDMTKYRHSGSRPTHALKRAFAADRREEDGKRWRKLATRMCGVTWVCRQMQG